MKHVKPKKLTKKTLAPPPIEWREPFDDHRSPVRITFRDSDPSRNGMKCIRIQKTDGSLGECIVKERVADSLEGNPSAWEIADYRECLECSEDVSDDKIAVSLKEIAEAVVDGILYIEAHPIKRAPVDNPAAHTVVSLRLPYALTHALLLWLRRNPDIPLGFDGDGDWCVSGYRLFEAGVLDERCRFTPGALSPTPEEVEEFPDIFISRDRMPQSDLVGTMEVNARHLVLCHYHDLLRCVADNPRQMRLHRLLRV